MKVQLLHFQGCPHVDAARQALRDALSAEDIEASVEEIDIGRSEAPAWSRGWGSPTVLVDGKDVEGQGPQPSAMCCRLYTSGAPSIESIRASIAATRAVPPATSDRIALPMIGAVTAAIAASACCLVPAVLAVAGVSSVGFAAELSTYRPYFLVGTAVALATGFWLAYRPRKDDCGCAAPRSRTAARLGLWITAILSLVVAAYPLMGSGTAAAGAEEAPAKATLELTVIGMDCKECTSTIANALERVPGVVSVAVDFASGTAVVRHDGRTGLPDTAIKAVEAIGYQARVKP